MNTGNVMRICCVVLVVALLTAEMTSAAPYNDYDNLRDLYELLLRSEAAGMAGQGPQSAFPNHQMERKGGRSPSLRLRFGRRADPLWNNGETPGEAPSN